MTNKKVTITIRESFLVRSMLHGEVTLELEIPVDQVLDIYAWCEATRYETGGTFNPAKITFGFPPEIEGR